MGNKQTHNNHHSYPERSLSWQPDPSNGLPQRRNSFTNQSHIPNGHVSTAMMPRGYAASEIGAVRYQKRSSPMDNHSKLGNKSNQTSIPKNNIMVQQHRPYQPPPGMEFMPPPYPPPPIPMYGSMPPPGPHGGMPPFIYPPPPFGPPPMDPLYISSRASSSSDSKRIKKLRQKQKISRNESNLPALSEIPHPHMYAIMPPPLPAGIYGPAVYRTRSMDNVYIKQNKMIENGPRGNNSHTNGRIDSRSPTENVYKGPSKHIKDAKISDNHTVNNRNEMEFKTLKVQTLHPMKDHLTPVDENLNMKAIAPRYSNRVGNTYPAECDSIDDNMIGPKPTLKKGKNARKNSQESPTAVNIHFEYNNDKEKNEKFRPVVTMVRSDAQAIMERNAKRLADAEWEEDHKPGVVVVNEDERRNYEDENDLNEKKIYGCLPARKVDDEVYQQRSLQRPVHSLKKETELREIKPTVLTPISPRLTDIPANVSSSSTGEMSSQTSSRRSSGSKRSVKMVKNYDERGEIMIEAILNPVLYQQKSKKAEEFKPLNAWNEINVSSELNKRRNYRSNAHSQKAINEKIMVRLIHSPPPKHTNQEPIYLDYDRRLPDFKKRLIETGSFGFSELDKFQQPPTNTLRPEQIVTNSKNINKKTEDWTNGETINPNQTKDGSKRQRYSFDSRSKSNVECEPNRLKSLTPSIAKIKAGDCSDIDFSWVDDLESRFRLEREQFERELQCIKERTLQRGIKPLQPADKTLHENQHKDQQYSTQQSSSMGEPSTMLDSSSHHTNSIEESSAINPVKYKYETNQKSPRYFGNYDSAQTNSNSASNYLRDYSVPNNDNRVSSVLDDTKRPDLIQNNNYNARSRTAMFENENNRQQHLNGHHFELQRYRNSRLPIEDEPIYIPKPDYEQMENENMLPSDSKMQHAYRNGGNINYLEQSQEHHSQYDPHFDRSLTVQTAQNHENSNRASSYAAPSPRSPSQRKLNRYYNPNAMNGTSNVYNSDSEWIEAEPENCNRERYNLQLSGSYAINPNIAEEFKSFDSVDKTFIESPNQNVVRQYNGGHMQYNRQQKELSDDNNTRRFVEKMNEFSSEENPKWSRNPTRNHFVNNGFQLTNGHVSSNESNSNLYISRPGSGKMKNNFISHRSNGNDVYGSSQY